MREQMAMGYFGLEVYYTCNRGLESCWPILGCQ